MVKRKAARKQKSKPAHAPAKPKKEAMPAPLFAIKALAVFLSVILVVALTLYVLGKMPARGFWVLVIILAVIGFGVMPWMRRRFGGM